MDSASDYFPSPRVPVENTGQIGQDGVTPHWVQLKYASQNADIPFAKWTEVDTDSLVLSVTGHPRLRLVAIHPRYRTEPCAR